MNRIRYMVRELTIYGRRPQNARRKLNWFVAWLLTVAISLILGWRRDSQLREQAKNILPKLQEYEEMRNLVPGASELRRQLAEKDALRAWVGHFAREQAENWLKSVEDCRGGIDFAVSGAFRVEMVLKDALRSRQ